MADENDKGLEWLVSEEGITPRVIWVRGSGEGQEKAGLDGVGDRGRGRGHEGRSPQPLTKMDVTPWVCDVVRGATILDEERAREDDPCMPPSVRKGQRAVSEVPLGASAMRKEAGVDVGGCNVARCPERCRWESVVKKECL